MSNVGRATDSKSLDFYSILDFSSYNVVMMIKIRVIVIVSVTVFYSCFITGIILRPLYALFHHTLMVTHEVGYHSHFMYENFSLGHVAQVEGAREQFYHKILYSKA